MLKHRFWLIEPAAFPQLNYISNQTIIINNKVIKQNFEGKKMKTMEESIRRIQVLCTYIVFTRIPLYSKYDYYDVKVLNGVEKNLIK